MGDDFSVLVERDVKCAKVLAILIRLDDQRRVVRIRVSHFRLREKRVRVSADDDVDAFDFARIWSLSTAGLSS